MLTPSFPHYMQSTLNLSPAVQRSAKPSILRKPLLSALFAPVRIFGANCYAI